MGITKQTKFLDLASWPITCWGHIVTCFRVLSSENVRWQFGHQWGQWVNDLKWRLPDLTTRGTESRPDGVGLVLGTPMLCGKQSILDSFPKLRKCFNNKWHPQPSYSLLAMYDKLLSCHHSCFSYGPMAFPKSNVFTSAAVFYKRRPWILMLSHQNNS